MRKKKLKRNTSSLEGWGWVLVVLGIGGMLSGILGYTYKEQLIELFLRKFEQVEPAYYGTHLTRHDIRNREILEKHIDKVLGIDVSHYQSKIRWKEVSWIYNEFPLNFVIMRATMGWNGKDDKFQSHWNSLKGSSMVRGAYHFYRPDEPSVEQAQNFINSVQLAIGDLPPILDIETLPSVQSMDRLKNGLKNWLDIVEKHYGVKPIIYSGHHFYETYLNPEFNEYTLWIANYNHRVKQPKSKWQMWQFTEKGQVNGIQGPVDLNVFNGTWEQFNRLRIKSVKQHF